jgi:hypothetical protein
VTKHKIEIKLPSTEDLTAGLTLQQVYPDLERAQESVAKAEQSLDRARRELAERERRIVDLPAKIHRGEVKASALTDALRERDAAALLVLPAEQALQKARETVTSEEKYAKVALEREFERRWKPIEQAAAEVTALLTEIGERATALSKVQCPEGICCYPSWPCSPECNASGIMQARTAAFASANGGSR